MNIICSIELDPKYRNILLQYVSLKNEVTEIFQKVPARHKLSQSVL